MANNNKNKNKNNRKASTAAAAATPKQQQQQQPSQPPAAPAASRSLPLAPPPVACKHGLLSSCDDCNVRPCKFCNKMGKFESFCTIGCVSRTQNKNSEWTCRMCKELYCCTGLRNCCKICHSCEKDFALRKECKVCFELFVPRGYPLTCKHHEDICGECIRISTNLVVSEGSLCVRCPAEGCNKEFTTAELLAWLSSTGRERYFNLVKELHAARLRTFDPSCSQWIMQNTKKCPNCHVLIEKNGGCHHMNCKTCGTHFQWNTIENPAEKEFNTNANTNSRRWRRSHPQDNTGDDNIIFNPVPNVAQRVQKLRSDSLPMSPFWKNYILAAAIGLSATATGVLCMQRMEAVMLR